MAIGHLPPSFPDERKAYYIERKEECEKDVQCDYDEIHRTIVELGKESWSERMAYQDLYSRYGLASEEANLLENLDRGIREKYEKFLHEGGKINHIESAKGAVMEASPFERYFSPEEKFAIEQALLAARETARQEIEGLITETKVDEYRELVERYKETKNEIEADLAEMRKLAAISDKYRADILSRIRAIEEGWSVVERGLDPEEVSKEVEHWQGTLEAFLHA